MRWFAEQFGLPEGAGGLLTSGGAMANFVALKTARDHRAGWDIRATGVQAGPPLALYASEEVHVTTDREADMLGLGAEAVRKIPVDAEYRMRVAAHPRRIDLRAGPLAGPPRPVVPPGTGLAVRRGYRPELPKD